MEDTTIQSCFDYLEIMLAQYLAIAEEKGYPYLIFSWDIINENGVVKPICKRAYIKDLNHIFRLVKDRQLDLSRIAIFDVATEQEIDKAIFTKEK